MNVDEYIAAVDLGDQAGIFLRGPLGQYIIGVSEQEAQKAADELMEADPHDTTKIIKLQIDMRVAKAAVGWLAEAIVMGQESEDQIIHMEADNG